MGKVVCDTTASDTSDEDRRKTVREEQKVRTKKKKRKRDLTDLHQKLFKSKKDKETKIDGKLRKARNSKKVSNRILPRPLTGIYRNGAAGKEIRRSQIKLPLNDINNARLQGNVLKLLHGYDSKSDGITVENDTKEVLNDPLLDSAIQNILQPTPLDDESISPILGKVDGKARFPRDKSTKSLNVPKIIELPQKPLEKKKQINFENLRNSAISKYEELCSIISAENFEGQNFPEFTTDPLTATKKKLRTIYAESFRSQFLRDMIKRGTILNENLGSSVENDLPPETEYCSSGYGQDSELVSVTIEKPECQIRCKKDKEESISQESQNPFLITEKNLNLGGRRNEVPTSHLLFDLSVLNASNAAVENVDVQLTSKMNNVESTKKIEEAHRSILFVPTEAEFSNNFISKKNLIKRKNQRTQTVHLLRNTVKKYSGKGNLKVSQPVKMKGLKHVPAILRRCNNAVANNSRVNLFDQSMHINKESREMMLDTASKQNVLFTPQSMVKELNESSSKVETSSAVNTTFNSADMKDLNVQTCVIASPSLRKNEVCFMKNSCSQPLQSKKQPQKLHINDIFLNNKNTNAPIQKTVMFTKKDSRNIGQCLHLNSLITDGTGNNSNVSVMRKNVPTEHKKSMSNVCMAHRHCQRVSADCYQPFRCSQNSDNTSYGSQEFQDQSASKTQNAQVHQKPIVCEKVLLRRVQRQSKCESIQKCHSNPDVCYVVVDQCKDSNNMRGYSNNGIATQIDKPRTVQSGHFCQESVPDVGILKGVQNLKILPMEEREQMSFTNNQCVGNTMVLEEQPIKYLAYENDSKTQKIPIYMQNSKHVTSVDNIEVINPNVKYHVVPYPQESSQKIIFVPTCEQNKVVCVKQQNSHSNVSFEEYSHPKKMIFYRPEFQSNVQCVKNASSLYEVHVPKQNVMEMRKAECDAIITNLQQADQIKMSRHGSTVNCNELHYQPNHEYPLVNDTCVRSQAVFYHK